MRAFKVISLIIIILFSCIFINSISGEKVNALDAKTWYVDDDGTADFTKIQDAIDNASDGDTVYVYSGEYYGNFIVNKSITLQGEDKNTTILCSKDTGYSSNCVLIKKNNVVIRGFTVKDSYFGIYVNSDYNIVEDNIVTNCTNIGIRLSKDYNTVRYNQIFKNNKGLTSSYDFSTDNLVYLNNFYYNNYQVLCDSDNQFDNGIYGNFWDDYNGYDNNSDGIGDSIKKVYREAVDRYPLVSKYPIGPNFKYSLEDTMVILNSTSFSHIGNNIIGYKWDFGDNTYGFGKNITHKYEKYGNYDITLTITDDKGKTDYITRRVKARHDVVYVDDDYTDETDGWNNTHFNKIKQSLKAIYKGGKIYVASGIYYEHIKILKKYDISLIGENKENTIIDGNGKGNVFQFDRANRNIISGFTIRNCGSHTGDTNTYSWEAGIHFYYKGNNNIIENCIITQNNAVGVLFGYGNNNIIKDCQINSNKYGICYLHCHENRLINNTISNNNRGIQKYYGTAYLDGNILSDNINCINGDGYYIYNTSFINEGLGDCLCYKVINTTVNNKPLIYLNEKSDMSIDYAGQVFLIGCNNVTVKNLDLSNIPIGILITDSTNCAIRDNSIINCNNCIKIRDDSNNNKIKNNLLLSNGGYGVKLEYCNKNDILSNTIKNNEYGLYFTKSKKNNIDNNQIINCDYGLYLRGGSHNNIITNNTIVNSEKIGISILSGGWGYNLYNNMMSILTPPPPSNDKNIIVSNIFEDNKKGIVCGGNQVSIKRNDFSKNTLALSYSGDNGEIIENNFQDNIKQVSIGGVNNNWDSNYWNRPRILPKILIGFSGYKFSISFDFHPLKEPYSI